MAKKTPKSLDDRLREAIKADDRAPTAIAIAAGVPHPVMSRFLSGKQSLTTATYEKLARVVGLNLGE